jgi:DNA-binding NarL/FixJ family response regulator
MSPQMSVAEPASPLRDAVRKSSLAIALVQLPTRKFVELSPRAATFLGGEQLVMPGTDALAVSGEPEASGRAFEDIANGVIDGYQARRTLRGGDTRIWTRALRRTGADRELVVIVTPVRAEPDQRDDDTHDDKVTVTVAVEPVEPGNEARPNHASLEYLIVPLLDIVHPDDIATILTAIERAAADRAQVAVVVRVRDEAFNWQRLRLSLGPIDDDSTHFGFALTATSETTAAVPPGERVIELEQRLRRIARELEAAGVASSFGRLPDAETVPGLEDLTSRQWEVATRLARGERVSEIARAMYLSPSTIRNHLTNLFRKVGVHSQSEFLELLRDAD